MPIGTSYALTIRPRTVLRAMLTVIAFLLLSHLVIQLLRFLAGYDFQFGLLRWLDLHEEANLPTWYSALSLLLCSALLGFIAWSHRRLRTGQAAAWSGLAMIFGYLSLDEATMIHETILEPMVVRLSSGGQWTGYWSYPWVIAGLALVAIVTALYLRFVIKLPPRTRTLFVVAALLYVGGAIGVELITARYDSEYGIARLGYSLWVMLEEGAEMSGVAIFCYSLLEYVTAQFGALQIGVATAGAARGAETRRAATPRVIGR